MTNSETGNWIITPTSGDNSTNTATKTQIQHVNEIATHAANDAAAAMEEAQHGRLIADTANRTSWAANKFAFVALGMSVGTLVFVIIITVIR